MRVGEVCNREVIVLDREDAIQRMRGRGVRRVAAVSSSGALTGVLAVDDLIDLIAEQLSDLVKLIGNEQLRERQRRG
jgi:Mg/Co/Ni transporter MgtE